MLICEHPLAVHGLKDSLDSRIRALNAANMSHSDGRVAEPTHKNRPTVSEEAMLSSIHSIFPEDALEWKSVQYGD